MARFLAAQSKRQLRSTEARRRAQRFVRGDSMSIFVGEKHALHPWFTSHNDELVVAGRPITQIAAQVGSTPFYAYDRSVMTRKVEQLRQTLPQGVHLHYAVKAN